MRLIRYFFLFILLCGSGCYADDSGYNLEFTGTIVAQTCDIEISSLSQSIDLGQFSGGFPSTGTTTKFAVQHQPEKLLARHYRQQNLVYRHCRQRQPGAAGIERYRHG